MAPVVVDIFRTANIRMELMGTKQDSAEVATLILQREMMKLIFIHVYCASKAEEPS